MLGLRSPNVMVGKSYGGCKTMSGAIAMAMVKMMIIRVIKT